MTDIPDLPTMEELFLEALDMEPSERTAFLEERCRGRPELRQEIDSLLEAHQAPDLLPEMEEERPFGGRYPERIGAYRIVRPLGEGGMGVVLLAIREGPGFEQTVALKLIRGSFHDPLLARRLEEERRILARLEHPGIARLVDGGVTPEGNPFYAMEYVSGEEILAWCDSRRLSVQQRINLFIQVCEAVHHAHQQLVVHRDLKPSNILVTPEGRPKLLDFGIAKNLEVVATPEQTSQWVTPAYASPEQVSGSGASTQSDVYALGVLLCESLSGARPLDTRGKSMGELARIIGSEPPRAPSTLVDRVDPDDPGEVARNRGTTPIRLRRILQGDLDLIVLKALAKEPGRRYESAWTLAEDLRRYLAGRPITARPDSIAYRTGKLVRRHLALSGAVLLLVLVLTAGIVGVVWQAGRAATERDRAELQAARAQQVTDLMTDIFRLGDPTQNLGDTIGVRQVLEEGVRRVEETLADDPTLQATLFLELAQIYRNLGILAEAERLGSQALAIRGVAEPGTPSHAEALGFQGLVLRDAGQSHRAIDHLQRAIRLREDLRVEPDTVLASLWEALAWEIRAQGEHEAAGSLFSQAMELRTRMLGPDDPSLGPSMLGLASALHNQGKFDEAETLLERILEEGAGSGATPLAANLSVNLGMIQRLRERYREAEPLLRRGLEMSRTLYEPDHPEVIRAEEQLGVDLVALGHYREARPLLAASLKSAVEVLGEDHESTRGIREAVATLEWELGQYTSAAARLDTVIAAKREAHGGDHPGVVYSLVFQGDVLLDGGNPTGAAARYQESLEMGGRLGGNDGVYGALARHGLARVALALDQLDRADSLSTLALEIARQNLREDHRYVLDLLRTRTRVLLEQGRIPEADSVLSFVIQREEDVRPHPHPRLGLTLTLLGEIRMAQGDAPGAREAIQEALEEFSMLPTNHPARRQAAERLGPVGTPPRPDLLSPFTSRLRLQ